MENESKCEESERKFLLLDQKKKNNSVEEGEKGKEKKKKRKEKNKGKKKKEKKRRKIKREEKDPCVEKKEKKKGFDSWCSDSWKLIGRELKLVYSPRATSRYQKHKEVDFSPTLVPPNLRTVNGRVV